MEEKKNLIDDTIEKITGGRHYAKKWPWLDSPMKEDLIKSAVRADSVSSEKLPEELLKKVSGGEWEDFHKCPKCGSSTWFTENLGAGWMLFCEDCGTLIDASWL